MSIETLLRHPRVRALEYFYDVQIVASAHDDRAFDIVESKGRVALCAEEASELAEEMAEIIADLNGERDESL